MDDTHLLVKKNSFNVVQCNGCGLVYLNPRLGEDELAELYNVSANSTVERITVSQREAKHDVHKIKKFKKAINLLKKHKRDTQNIFDLGCSTGIFLGMVAKEGWTPYGSDVNCNLVEKNQVSYGDRVKIQAGNRIDFPDQYFDAVTLFDSIEHMPNPISTLKEVARVVRDDGLVVISTPNVDGLFPRLTFYLLCKTISAWEHPTPPGHVFQFSKRTLHKTLKKAGFEWIDSRNFESFRPYTVGELENSIINVLRRRNNNTTKNHGHETWSNETTKLDNNHVSIKAFFPVKKLPRLLMHEFCLWMVTAIYPLAKLLGYGDSMVIVARKARKVGMKTYE